MMNIVEATRLYEQWLTGRIPCVPADFDAKHQGMALDKQFFLRATDYRFAQLFPELCKEQCKTPMVFSTGDMHVQQVSTWRDGEARLNFGVADFDEADLLPCTFDLVRLATSVGIAIEREHLRIDRSEALAAILQGYADSIACGGRPLVLEEDNPELREMAIDRLIKPAKYWQKLDSQLTPISEVPPELIAAIEHLLPSPKPDCQFFTRQAGAGSLGGLRVVATGTYRGARFAREAKFMHPSAWNWANGDQNTPSMLEQVLRAAISSADPLLKTYGPCVVRRLSPACSHIRLSDLPKRRAEGKLLWAMGFVCANVQQGTTGATAALVKFLRQYGHSWLSEAAGIMGDALDRDFDHWCKHHHPE